MQYSVNMLHVSCFFGMLGNPGVKHSVSLQKSSLTQVYKFRFSWESFSVTQVYKFRFFR